jgi:cytochrome c-type biogenesis protein CcmH
VKGSRGTTKRGLNWNSPATLAFAALAALLMLVALPAPRARAATPQTTITDIEDEVMCPICGTLLELANSPQAKREKVFIAKLIAAGKTKQEIKEALVSQYGQQVLALPRGSGFDLTAYLVPVIAFIVALTALAIGVRRWRRQGRSRQADTQGAKPPEGEDAERLEADLARYDL